jgi:hypothetical protein
MYPRIDGNERKSRRESSIYFVFMVQKMRKLISPFMSLMDGD